MHIVTRLYCSDCTYTGYRYLGMPTAPSSLSARKVQSFVHRQDRRCEEGVKKRCGILSGHGHLVRIFKGEVPESLYVRGPKLGATRKLCTGIPDELQRLKGEQKGSFFATPVLKWTLAEAPEVRAAFEMEYPSDDWVRPAKKRHGLKRSNSGGADECALRNLRLSRNWRPSSPEARSRARLVEG